MTKLTAAAIFIALAATAGAAGAQSLVSAEAPVTNPVASIDLGKEFPAMKGYNLQQTWNVIAPNTGRKAHSHKDQPEIVRIISGVLTDQRVGGQPVKYGPGSNIVNDGTTVHMWANFGTEPVVMVNTSIKPAPPAK